MSDETFNQCPHEVIRATCPGCNCPCSACDRWRARENDAESGETHE